ncbi:hypothetical protein [Amycolatopsis sp. NPDC051903]|uniref:hypothetical protein n=1 Tax=Amycolatopsis sp. NPDC051903 TaxID=3363936 RepID=UPI0037BAC2C3
MPFDRLIGIIGTALGVVGIIISFFLAKRGRERPEIRHLEDFDVVISPEDALLNRGLELQFNGRNINTVSRTIFAVWNRRGSTLLGTDVVPEDKLRLQLGDKDIVLRARIVAFSRPQIKATLTTGAQHKANQVILDFDFLDPSDGFIVEVIHPGPDKPTMEGTMRGARLVSIGNGTLTAATLDYMTEKSRITRIKNWFSRQGVGFLISGSTQIAFITAVLAYYIANYVNSPKDSLVPVSKYNLQTLDGQKDFAGAINRINDSIGPIPTVYVFALLAVLSVLGFTWLLRRRTMRIIPKSIVTHRVTDEQADEAPEQPTSDAIEQSGRTTNSKARELELRRKRPQVARDRDPWQSSPSLKLSVGDRVEHAKYGFGTVRIVEGTGSRTTATVDFGEKGNVRLMLLGSVPMRKVDK